MVQWADVRLLQLGASSRSFLKNIDRSCFSISKTKGVNGKRGRVIERGEKKSKNKYINKRGVNKY